MIDRILAFFSYTPVLPQYEEITVMDDKKELIIREYDITITTVNGDILTVPFAETLEKKLRYSDKFRKTYGFDHYTVQDYVNYLMHRGYLSFDFPNNTGIRNLSEIKKIEYAATDKVKLLEVYRETITKKLRTKNV